MFNKKATYIVNYDGWHFESIWNEFCEAWSIYQSEKTDNGNELRRHYFNDKPIVKAEEAKEQVDYFEKRLRQK